VWTENTGRRSLFIGGTERVTGDILTGICKSPRGCHVFTTKANSVVYTN